MIPQSKATLCENRCPGLGKQNILLSQEVSRGTLETGSWGDLDLNPEAGWLWGHALIFLWAPSPSLVWASHAQAVGVFSGRGGLSPSTSCAKWAGSEGTPKASAEEVSLNLTPLRSPALQQPLVLCSHEHQKRL